MEINFDELRGEMVTAINHKELKKINIRIFSSTGVLQQSLLIDYLQFESLVDVVNSLENDDKALVFDDKKIESIAGREWEKNAQHHPTGINPTAFILGFKAAFRFLRANE